MSQSVSELFDFCMFIFLLTCVSPGSGKPLTSFSIPAERSRPDFFPFFFNRPLLRGRLSSSPTVGGGRLIIAGWTSLERSSCHLFTMECFLLKWATYLYKKNEYMSIHLAFMHCQTILLIATMKLSESALYVSRGVWNMIFENSIIMILLTSCCTSNSQRTWHQKEKCYL